MIRFCLASILLSLVLTIKFINAVIRLDAAGARDYWQNLFTAVIYGLAVLSLVYIFHYCGGWWGLG
jgi:hypothetical protein